jgi:cell division protein FtsB
MVAQRGNGKIKALSTILICVLVLLLVILIAQFTNIMTLKNKQKKLETTYQHTQQQIEEYNELIDYINYSNGEYSQEFLESYAREVYGWGKANRHYYTQG